MNTENAGTIGKFSISIKITIAVLLAISGTSLSLAYIFLPLYRAEISFIATVAVGCAILYSAFYAGMSFKNKIEQDKIKNSYGFINLMHNVELTKFRTKLDNEFDHESTAPKDFYEKLNSDIDIVTTVRTMLNICENLSIAIQKDFVDEEIIYQSLVGVVYRMHQRFIPYIKHTRKMYNDNRTFCELEKLATAWESGKFLSSGKEIPQRLL